tara:strand:+ start:2626 stop:3852 length:1227 start_codon:yes stop_codon:yes gene_type:complete
VGISRSINYFGPGTYFHKSINFFDNKRIRDIKSKGNFYISLDEEGGYQLKNEADLKKFLEIRTSHENVKNIDLLFNWGKFDNKICKKIYHDYNKKFIITGSPRVDLWSKKFVKKIYSEELKKIDSFCKKNFTLIISSNISSLSDVKRVFRIAYKNFKFNNMKDKRLAFKNISQELKDFKKFSDIIVKIIKSNPTEFFLLRPHPAENLRIWKNIIKKNNLKNILINNKFDATPWIFKSKSIIQSKSSLSIEASILKKKIISIDLKNKRRTFPNKFGINLTNQNKIKNILSGKKNFVYKSKIKKELFYRILNSNKKYISADIITKNIENLYKKNIYLSYTKVLILSCLFKIYDYFIKFFRKERKIDQIMNKKLSGGISRNEILKYIKIFDAQSKYVVIKISKNTFYIKKN